MAVDGWFVQFVAADKAQRKTMLRGKNKIELVKICKYFHLATDGNTVHLINRLTNSYIKLPI